MLKSLYKISNKLRGVVPLTMITRSFFFKVKSPQFNRSFLILYRSIGLFPESFLPEPKKPDPRKHVIMDPEVGFNYSGITSVKNAIESLQIDIEMADFPSKEYRILEDGSIGEPYPIKHFYSKKELRELRNMKKKVKVLFEVLKERIAILEELKDRSPRDLSEEDLFLVMFETYIYPDPFVLAKPRTKWEWEFERRQRVAFFSDPYYRSKAYRAPGGRIKISMTHLFRMQNYDEECEKFKRERTIPYYDKAPFINNKYYGILDKHNIHLFNPKFFKLFRFVSKDATVTQRRSINYYNAERVIHLKVPDYPQTPLPWPLKLKPYNIYVGHLDHRSVHEVFGRTLVWQALVYNWLFDMYGCSIWHAPGYHFGPYFTLKFFTGFILSFIWILWCERNRKKIVGHDRHSVYKPVEDFSREAVIMNRFHRTKNKRAQTIWEHRSIVDKEQVFTRAYFFPRQIRLPTFKFTEIHTPYYPDEEEREIKWQINQILIADLEEDSGYTKDIHLDHREEDYIKAGMGTVISDSPTNANFSSMRSYLKGEKRVYDSESYLVIHQNDLLGKLLFFPDEFHNVVKSDLLYIKEQAMGTLDTQDGGFEGNGMSGEEVYQAQEQLISKLLINNPKETAELLKDGNRIHKIRGYLGDPAVTRIMKGANIDSLRWKHLNHDFPTV